MQNLIENIKNDIKEVASKCQNDSSANSIQDEKEKEFDREIHKFIAELISKKESEITTLNYIKQHISSSEPALIQSQIHGFQLKNERNFLDGKYLDCFDFNKKKIEKSTGTNSYFLNGQYSVFESEFKILEDEIFYFHLPPFVRKATRSKRIGDGKALENLIIYLIIEKKKKGYEITKKEKAAIIFVHNIKEGTHKNFVPDLDNLDLKVFLDAIQGSLIYNDTLLDLSLIQFGNVASDSSTDVYISNQNDLEKVLKIAKKI